MVPYLEIDVSNGSLFRNWIATPLPHSSIFRNRLQPYLETFRKATPTPTVTCLESGGSNGSLFRNWIATPRSNDSMFRKWWFQWFPI